MQIKLQFEPQKNKSLFTRTWEMGSCFGPNKKRHNGENWPYEKKGTYLERCCLSPGLYVLTCRNEKGPFGWGNSFLEIQGMRYCDDFFGSKTFRQVLVQGKCLISLFKNLIYFLFNVHF